MGRSCQKDLLDWLFAHVFQEEPYILLTILRASEEFPKTNTGISSTRVGKGSPKDSVQLPAPGSCGKATSGISHTSLVLYVNQRKKYFTFVPARISDLEFFLGITRLREYPYTFLKRMKNCSMIRLPGLIRIRVADP